MIAQLIALGPRWRGSSDGWYWIVPCVGAFSTALGDHEDHERHDHEVGLEPGELGGRVVGLERLGLAQLEARLARGLGERVGRPALLVGRAVDRDDVLARARAAP